MDDDVEESIIDIELIKVFIIVGIVIAAIILMVAAILLVKHGNRNAAKDKLDELNQI